MVYSTNIAQCFYMYWSIHVKKRLEIAHGIRYTNTYIASYDLIQ